ncbi:MAG: hypothetical protein HOP30_05315 [Cyclobacteriaceae bacterium]|nr:hypothetical protein [Cyclobacteriaceae bacterium]
MSSHHIVREDQEPALFILSAEALSFEKVQELLEWSPTVMVAEWEVNKVKDWRIKIDVVLCGETSLERLKEELADQAPIKFISFHSAEDCLATGMYYLLSAKYKAVNILTNSTDAFSFLSTFNNIDMDAFINNQKWSFIQKMKFEKWVGPATQFQVYPNQLPFSTTGLSSTLLSELSGMISIRATTPFWVGEELV